MGLLRGFLAILLLVNHAVARPPATEIQTSGNPFLLQLECLLANHNLDHHSTVQDGTHSSVHEMETEEMADEGDGSLNKEVVLETNQDEEVEEVPVLYPLYCKEWFTF